MRFWSKQIQRVWNVSSSAKIRLGYTIVGNNEVNVLLDVVRTSDFFPQMPLRHSTGLSHYCELLKSLSMKIL